MFCTQCGNKVTDGFRFCTNCGALVEDREAEELQMIQPQTVEAIPEVPMPAQPISQQEVFFQSEEPVQPEAFLQPEVFVQPEIAAQPQEIPQQAEYFQPEAVPVQNEWEQIPVQQQVPEMQYPQWPGVQEYSPAEQQPVVDVYSDAQYLAYEAEQTSNKPKKAKKSEKKAKPGKKKGLILVIVILLLAVVGVGGFMGWKYYEMNKTYDKAQEALAAGNFDEALKLFESLDNFEDSATIAGELSRKQETYDEAMELLDNGEYDDAQKLFKDLGEYKDAPKMAEFKVVYEKASYIADCAENGDETALKLVLSKDEAIRGGDEIYVMYRCAANLFAGLGEYEDAPAKADACWIAAGEILLEREAWDEAEALMEAMTDSARAEFNDMFLSCFCDGEALDALTASVEEFNAFKSLDANYRAAIDKHISILEAYKDETFRVEGIRDLLDDYVSGLEAEFKVLDKDGKVKDTIAWYKARAIRFTALDELNAQFGYLEDNKSLKDKNIGQGEYYTNCAAIAEDLSKQANSKKPMEDDQGNLYLEYTNNTDCDFELTYHFVFRDDSGEVGKSESSTMQIKSGETVKIPMNVPEDCPEWTRWSFYRSFKIAD